MTDTRYYELDGNRFERTLVVKLRGYWNIETAHRFHRETTEKLTKLRHVQGDYFTIVDLSDYDVQSADVTLANEEFIKSLGSLAATKVAFVSGKALLRMQTSRISKNETTRLFQNMSDALIWISAEKHQAHLRL